MTEALKPTLAGKAAVLEGLAGPSGGEGDLGWNAEALEDAQFEFGELTLTIAPEQIRAALADVAGGGLQLF